jgi:type IV pilus assembly protein PilW
MTKRRQQLVGSIQATYCRGMSLVELMLAMAIGVFLIGGAFKVYLNGRSSHNVNESIAELQENARYAISVIEPDVQMANYWGYIKDATAVSGRTKPTAAASSLLPPAANSCANNFAVNLERFIQGDNNQYGYNVNSSSSSICNPKSGTAMSSADTLTVRRAAIGTVVSDNQLLQICSTPVDANLSLGGIAASGIPCPTSPDGQINNLTVNTYYVDSQSDNSTTLPSLRRKSLITGPDFQDVEIIPGVEDMQIQLGWDQTGGQHMLDGAGNVIPPGSVTRYVDPNNVPTTGQIVAVRIWLLLRVDRTETGFTNNAIYSYGDRTGTATSTLQAQKAYAPNDGFRRLLVSRTIFIRNAVGT